MQLYSVAFYNGWKEENGNCKHLLARGNCTLLMTSGNCTLLIASGNCKLLIVSGTCKLLIASGNWALMTSCNMSTFSLPLDIVNLLLIKVSCD